MAYPGTRQTYPENGFWQRVQEEQLEQIDKKLWEEMRQAVKTNVTLEEEFERFKVIYFLSKGAEGGG